MLIINLWCWITIILHKTVGVFAASSNTNKFTLEFMYMFVRDVDLFLLSLPNKVWGTYWFCSVSYYYFFFSSSYSSSFFPCTMNLSTADLRNYRTEFHETWWSYRYMFLVDPKVFRFVVKGVKAIFLGVQRGWGLL